MSQSMQRAPEDVDLATARRQRMRAGRCMKRAFCDVTGILHIGIGGSVLAGPGGRRAWAALVRVQGQLLEY
jgi:hypothetical protein